MFMRVMDGRREQEKDCYERGEARETVKRSGCCEMAIMFSPWVAGCGRKS